MLSNASLDLLDESEPAFIFSIDHQIARFHENQKLNVLKIRIKLIFDLIVVQIDFCLMDIAIDISLAYDSFVCLGDDGNKIIEQYNDHEHCLEEPDSPGETNHKITRYWTDFARLSLK